MTTEPRFYTATGRLTSYGFACGYIETRTSYEGERIPPIKTTFWREHNCYHVRTTGLAPASRVWDVADTLTEARRLYARHCRRFHYPYRKENR